MIFEWDDAKNETNIQKHGISFELASSVFLDDKRLEYYDKAHSGWKEDRYITIGSINGYTIVITVVYSERNNSLRIISARKATSRERKKYYEGI